MPALFYDKLSLGAGQYRPVPNGQNALPGFADDVLFQALPASASGAAGGSSTSTSTVSGIGSATFNAVGTANSTSSVLGTGAPSGSAISVSTVLGVGAAFVAAVGTAQSVSIVGTLGGTNVSNVVTERFHVVDGLGKLLTTKRNLVN